MSAKKLFFIFILMLIVFLGVLWGLVYYDVAGVQKYARTITFIDKLLPPKTEFQKIEEELETYSYNKLLKYTVNLFKQNEVNKEEIQQLKAEVIRISELNPQSEAEIERLRQYETEYINIKKITDELQQAIAKGDPEGYKKYYETIKPDIAKEIYQEIVEAEKRSEDFNRYLQSFTNMNPQNAANIIEQLVRTDYNIAVDIFRRLEPEVSSLILEKMEPASASAITKTLGGI